MENESGLSLGNQDHIFARIPESVQSRLIQNGITTPTEIQAQAFQPIVEGRDILAQSMTGSGKTLAFSLPLALRLVESVGEQRPRGVRALILTPTRELATQVADAFGNILGSLGLKTLSVIGGTSYSRQEQALSRGTDVVIGTPGRVVDLIERGTLKMAHIQTFVLDEVDQMLDFGFADDLAAIKRALPEKVQTLFFSATISHHIGRLARQLLVDPVEVKVGKKDTPSTIRHGYLFVKVGNRLAALVNALMYYDPGQAIVFCETKKECAEVTASLIKRGFNASQLNSDLGQAERQATMDRFRRNELRYLVATNVAARGIDIQDLPLVVNYEVARDTESYTHRCGRTGRAGASGLAWTIVTPRDIRLFVNLMREVKISPELIQIPDRIDILTKVAEREVQSLLKPVEDKNINELTGVVDKTLEAVPNEAARSILAGFLSQKLSSLEIFNSSDFRCTGELTIGGGGPRPRGYDRGPRDGGRHPRYNQNRRDFDKGGPSRIRKYTPRGDRD